MTDDIIISTNPTPTIAAGGQGYTLAGRNYPRVTTVLGVIAKPGLEAWKHRVGLAEAERISRTSAEFGTRVHKACEAVARGVEPPADADLQPFIAVYRRWFEASVKRVLGLEQAVHSEKWGYAGSLDLRAVLSDGRRAVLDIKTGGGVDASARFQMAAYQLALQELGTPVVARIVLHLPREKPGRLSVVEFDNEDKDRRAWLAILRVFNRQREVMNEWRIKHPAWAPDGEVE